MGWVVVRMASIIGPGIGGLSVFLIGGRMTFLFTAIAFSFGTYFLAQIKEDVNSDKKAQEPFLTELREGLRTVWEIKWVGAMIAMASVQLMVVLAAENVLLPVITRREFHTNTVFALSAAAFSVGGIISAIACVKLKIKHEGRFSVLVWALLIIAPLSLAFPVNEYVVVVAYLLAGFSVGPWEAFWNSAIQREIPQELQGRVFSIDHMGTSGLMPLGMALVGPGFSVGPWEAFWNSAIQREIPQELQGRVFSIDHMGTSGLMPLGMALVGPAVILFGEKNLLIGASIFHVIICFLVLLVPGVKDMKAPNNYSQGEQG